MAADAVLCTDGSAMLAAAARDLGLEHHGLNALRGERKRGGWHTERQCLPRPLQGWDDALQGFATSYLPIHQGGFRALDRNAQSGASAASLLALAMAP